MLPSQIGRARACPSGVAPALAASRTGQSELLRAQLAGMSDRQLHRFIDRLDALGAPSGRTYAVHQADPRDPASRELVTLEVRPAAPRRSAKMVCVEGARAQPASEADRCSATAPRFLRIVSAALDEQRRPTRRKKMLFARRQGRRRQARTMRPRRGSFTIWLAVLASLALAVGF
jgi:hypothetical protein